MNGMRWKRRPLGSLALRDSVQVVAVVQMWAAQVSDPGYKPREMAFRVTLGPSSVRSGWQLHLGRRVSVEVRGATAWKALSMVPAPSRCAVNAG